MQYERRTLSGRECAHFLVESAYVQYVLMVGDLSCEELPRDFAKLTVQDLPRNIADNQDTESLHASARLELLSAPNSRMDFLRAKCGLRAKTSLALRTVCILDIQGLAAAAARRLKLDKIAPRDHPPTTSLTFRWQRYVGPTLPAYERKSRPEAVSRLLGVDGSKRYLRTGPRQNNMQNLWTNR